MSGEGCGLPDAVEVRTCVLDESENKFVIHNTILDVFSPMTLHFLEDLFCLVVGYHGGSPCCGSETCHSESCGHEDRTRYDEPPDSLHKAVFVQEFFRVREVFFWSGSAAWNVPGRNLSFPPAWFFPILACLTSPDDFFGGRDFPRTADPLKCKLCLKIFFN